jgi:hypothetical protein
MTYRLVHELQQKAIPVTHACRVLQVAELVIISISSGAHAKPTLSNDSNTTYLGV